MPPGLMGKESELDDVWSDGITSTVQRLRTVTPVVRVIGDAPRVDVLPADCVSAPRATMGDCTPPAYQHTVHANRVTRAAAAEAGVQYVDVEPLTCAHGRCPLVVDRTLTYEDDDHLSVTWSRRLAEDLGARLALPPFRSPSPTAPG
jgi:hypothetical protein